MIGKAARSTAFGLGLIILMCGCRYGDTSKNKAVRFEDYVAGQLAQFHRLDPDGDGAVAYKDLRPKVAKRYRRMDKDDDGQLTARELNGGVLESFKKADADRDGVVEPSEQH